ncbi:MAG: hypothetical protein J6S89_06250 [Paludibacteraceae bacterium]|nr:hypothetical protein [Paludibacteraceae bacterium]
MLFKDRLEVWNPSILPQGMTIAKLNKAHTSNPVNPVLTNSVYPTDYRTNWDRYDHIIDHYLACKLRKPEFHHDNLQVII